MKKKRRENLDNPIYYAWGWFLILVSVMSLVYLVLFIKSMSNVTDIIIISILIIIIMVFQFLVGLRLIEKSMNEYLHKKYKKKLLKFSCYILCIIVLLVFINVLFLEKVSTIEINDISNIELEQDYRKNYLIINGGELVLSCNSSDYFDVVVISLNDDKASFVIQYKWNVLKADKGRIINLEIRKKVKNTDICNKQNSVFFNVLIL